MRQRRRSRKQRSSEELNLYGQTQNKSERDSNKELEGNTYIVQEAHELGKTDNRHLNEDNYARDERIEQREKQYTRSTWRNFSEEYEHLGAVSSLLEIKADLIQDFQEQQSMDMIRAGLHSVFMGLKKLSRR